MAKLLFGMNLSLDGYVDHDKFAPEPAMCRHWIERVSALTGRVYGRRMYEIMRYWDEDRAAAKNASPAHRKIASSMMASISEAENYAGACSNSIWAGKAGNIDPI
jgi:hypothetical protein